ncbi:hypothetical protein LSAT2_030195 [Lamellibrachia satsuma]|nr:hypothetical protein LSAT2_030195 [Lamellibrachia satsuma]
MERRVSEPETVGFLIRSGQWNRRPIRGRRQVRSNSESDIGKTLLGDKQHSAEVHIFGAQILLYMLATAGASPG